MKNFKIFIFIGLIFFSTPILAQPMTLILDWFMNPNHAPLFVAEQQGFFKQQGLEVTFINPADPTDPPKLVAAGKADLAITYEPQLIIQQQQGLPLTRIATLINTPLNCLAVNANSNIHTLADLKGKRIGYSTGATDFAILQAMLASQGLALKDVQLINVRYGLTQALLSHQVDAVIGVMRNFEPIEMKLAGQPARIFPVEKYGVPAYDELIFIANSNKLSNAAIKKFVTALTQGVTYLQQHPAESWTAFAKAHPELNNELNRRAWFATLPNFAKNPGSLDKNRVALVTQFFGKCADL